MSEINCPHCKQSFQLESAVTENLRTEFLQKFATEKKQLEEKMAEANLQQLKKLEEQQQLFIQEKEKFAETKKRENELFKTKLEQELNKEKEKVKNEIQQASLAEYTALQQELQVKNEKIKEAQEQELKLRSKARELEDRQQAMELEIQRKIDDEIKVVEEKIKRHEADAHNMKIKEKDHLIESIKKQMDDMQRKVEQGSMQLQGEVQELALEKLLQQTFIYDKINEVGKGVKGADCVQQVYNNMGMAAGSIIFESKRTKEFSPSWLDKLKEDQRNGVHDIAILVTQVMPKDMDTFGWKDGIWICQFNEVKPLVTVLRDGLLKIAEAKKSQENKGEKMTMLYNYLTGNEFVQQVQAIVQGFTQLKMGLDNEKKAMQKIWASREKQIELVINSTINMYGAVQGIAGSAIQNIPALELNANDNLLLD